MPGVTNPGTASGMRDPEKLPCIVRGMQSGVFRFLAALHPPCALMPPDTLASCSRHVKDRLSIQDRRDLLLLVWHIFHGQESVFVFHSPCTAGPCARADLLEMTFDVRPFQLHRLRVISECETVCVHRNLQAIHSWCVRV